jgi:hypothetical protein
MRFGPLPVTLDGLAGYAHIPADLPVAGACAQLIEDFSYVHKFFAPVRHVSLRRFSRKDTGFFGASLPAGGKLWPQIGGKVWVKTGGKVWGEK